MSNWRSLVLNSTNKAIQRIQDADTLIVGSGVTTNTGNLTLNASGGTIAIAATLTLNANQNINMAAGTGSADFSSGSGAFKTTTGAVTVGPGTVTVSGTTTFTASGTALTVNNDTTLSGNVVLGTSTAQTINFNGCLNTDITGIQGANRTISIAQSTATSTAGATLTVSSGIGSLATGSTAGAAGGTATYKAGSGGAAAGGSGAAGAGGAATFRGGTGGAGTATGVAGAGGATTVKGGDAGANNGAGGANGGAVTIDSGAGTGSGTGAAISIGGTNATAVNIGYSSITTTVTGGFTQQTGAVNITGNAASSITTSSGALTITSAAAATWSTSAGMLALSGFSAVHLQVNGSDVLNLTSSTSAVIQAGVTLSTTSTGNINLPNNANARFQIEGVSVSANVTAANLGTLTAGSSSNADALHTHSGVNASQLVVSGLTTTGVTDGLAGYISANSTVSKTDSAAIGTARFFGINEGTVGSMTVQGTVMDATFTTAGGSPNAGDPVFLAAASDDTNTGAGKLTATAPTSGVLAEVGICMDNTNYASLKTSKVLIQVKPPVQL